MCPPRNSFFASRLLSAIENIEKAIQVQTDAINSAGEQARQKEHPPPEVRAEIHFPEQVEIANANEKKKARSLAKWNVIIAGAAFVVLTIVAGISLSELRVMRKTTKALIRQTDLMSQQLEGLMGAVVTLQEPRITPDPITGHPLLVMSALNREGRVMARNVFVHFGIKITSFPRTNMLLQSASDNIDIPKLTNGSFSKNYPLSNFTHGPFIGQKTTVTVEGNFGFEDGFGDKAEQRFCYSYIGFYNYVNEHTAGSTSGGGGFLPCDNLEKW